MDLKLVVLVMALVCHTMAYEAEEENAEKVFRTLEEGLLKQMLSLQSRSQEHEKRQNICSLPTEKGPCRNYLPRYGYNSATGNCDQFIYGGCRGNGNNFATKTQCQQMCGGLKRSLNLDIRSQEQEERQNICSLPTEKGPCRNYLPRYGYNSATGNCDQFIYGGCRGNGNNFSTKAQCQQMCGGKK